MNRVPFFELSVFEGRLFVGGTKKMFPNSPVLGAEELPACRFGGGGQQF